MIFSPEPHRWSHKQAALAEIIDPGALPASGINEHAHIPPLTPPITPTTYAQRQRSNSAPPWPAHKSGNKHCLPPVLAATSQLNAWIISVSTFITLPDPCHYSSVSPPSDRPSSCPAVVDVTKGKRHTPPSFATIFEHMAPGQPRRQYEETASSHNTSATISPSGRVGTRQSMYRGVLEDNFVQVDYLGMDNLPSPLKTFISTQILSSRLSPQLSDTAVAAVRGEAASLRATGLEAAVTEKLLASDMFPCTRPGIAKGGGSQWNTVALPNDPTQMYSLSAPKPDAHFGYIDTQKLGGWTGDQRNVLKHPVARPYALPTRSNAFPFLMFEVKSELAGGTHFVAENQVAGSGSHSVNAVSWLLQQAGTYDSASLTDTIAFSVTLTPNQANFHLHWRSEADRCYYMSHLKSYSPLEVADVRACNSTVKNIIDYGLGARKTTIGAALEALFPFPEQWTQRPSIASKRTRSPMPAIAAPEVEEQEQEQGGDDVVVVEMEEHGNDDEDKDEDEEEKARPKKKLRVAQGKEKRAAKGKKR